MLASGAGLTNVPYLVTLVAFRGFGLSGGSRDGFVLAARRVSGRRDNVGEDWDGGGDGATRVPHLLANEAGQGLVKVIVLHSLKEDLGDLTFLIGSSLGDAGVDLSVVPMEKEFGGDVKYIVAVWRPSQPTNNYV